MLLQHNYSLPIIGCKNNLGIFSNRSTNTVLDIKMISDSQGSRIAATTSPSAQSAKWNAACHVLCWYTLKTSIESSLNRNGSYRYHPNLPR